MCSLRAQPQGAQLSRVRCRLSARNRASYPDQGLYLEPYSIFWSLFFSLICLLRTHHGPDGTILQRWVTALPQSVPSPS